MIVFLDLETTGLNYHGNDEFVQIGIVDENGEVLLNSLSRPVNHKDWSAAEAVHSISPEMTKDAPTNKELSETIKNIIRDKEVIIYNLEYDVEFILDEIAVAKSAKCCMKPFAELYGEWNDYHGNYKWQKLETAARYVAHNWDGNAHDAAADCQATRSVWNYMKSIGKI
ncbi:hypothetical protein A9Q81_02800 [Gammaproteobacteria bacterium 42_54_T18]|nr:hypothetical protein A9Q81_02800 [Gammaproteobacteria bacterium 42_54_T18]